MGYYFERASRELLAAFQEHKVPVSVWNGQKVIKTTSDKLSFAFDNGAIDDLFEIPSVTFILTETNLFDKPASLYSNSNSNRAVTYIIPRVPAPNFVVESGPNANRIICISDYDMNIVLKSVMPVI